MRESSSTSWANPQNWSLIHLVGSRKLPLPRKQGLVQEYSFNVRKNLLLESNTSELPHSEQKKGSGLTGNTATMCLYFFYFLFCDEENRIIFDGKFVLCNHFRVTLRCLKPLGRVKHWLWFKQDSAVFSCFSGKDLASLRISQHILWYGQKSMRKTNRDGKQKEEKEIERRRSRKVREWSTL